MNIRTARFAPRGEVTKDTAHRLFAETVVPYLDDALALARWLTGSATDAEDVVQETCLRALRALQAGPAANARPWVLAITRNTAFTWLARNRPKSLVFAADIETVVPASDAEPSGAPDAALIAAADSAAVEAALARLSLPFREVLVMREINGLTYRDIAQAIGAPIGTVMSRLARARRLMLVELRGHLE